MHRIALIIFGLSLIAQPVLAQDDAARERDKKPFAERISFEEGTFLGDANVKFMAFIGHVEAWRLEHKEKTDASLDTIETRREDQKDPSTAVKVLTILHIAFLALMLFVFSLQFIFWTIGILLTIMIIRKFIRWVVGWARRDHIEA